MNLFPNAALLNAFHRELERRSDPALLEDADTLFNTLRFGVGDNAEQVLVLAEGFADLAHPEAFSPDDLHRIVSTLTREGKTTVLCNTPGMTDFLRDWVKQHPGVFILGMDGDHSQRIEDLKCGDRMRRFFLLPEPYVEKRIFCKATRRKFVLDQRVQNHPRQDILFAGTGAFNSFPDPRIHQATAAAQVTISFSSHDTYRCGGDLPRMELPYDPYDFGVNIERMDRALVDLHLKGYTRVTVLLEGSPQVFDLPQSLSLYHRQFHFLETSMPASVRLCEALGAILHASIVDPGYILCSGHFTRYGLMRAEFRARLEAFFNLNLTCILSEVGQGDAALIREMANRYRKHLLVFENIGKSVQRILHLHPSGSGSETAITSAAGQLVTVAVVDETRLPVRLIKTLRSAAVA